MPSTDTITAFYNFSAGTVIRSANVNTNFDAWRGHVIPVDPNTTTAGVTLTWDLGSSARRWRNVYGRVVPAIAETTGSMTITTTHQVVLMDSTSATTTATLFAVSGNTGASVVIKNVGTAGKTVLIDGNSSETIENTITVNLIDDESAQLVCNGSRWVRI